MTPESSSERIQRLQKEKEVRLNQIAQQVRNVAGGEQELHKLATFLQDAAHLEYEARTLPGAPVESPERKPIRENPRYDPNAKTIPF